jgi:hypothetical protein
MFHNKPRYIVIREVIFVLISSNKKMHGIFAIQDLFMIIMAVSTAVTCLADIWEVVGMNLSPLITMIVLQNRLWSFPPAALLIRHL